MNADFSVNAYLAAHGRLAPSLDARALQDAEPYLAPVLAGALHWTQPTRALDPHALGKM